jgi:hypothetical protein
MDKHAEFRFANEQLGPDKKSFGVLVLSSVVDNVMYCMKNERHIL